MPAPTAPTIPPRRVASPTPAKTTGSVTFSDVPAGTGQRIVIYGPGGVGKTSEAAAAPGPVAFFDLDESLPILLPQLPDDSKKSVRCVQADSFQAIRDALNAPGWDAIRTIVIDSATKAEELVGDHVMATIPHEKGNKIHRLSDYGWGKEFDHIYNVFNLLLGDLDNHARKGRNVTLVCHDCTNEVPNPAGDNWIRYEPRLQSPKSGKSSVRHRVREWADHMLFIGYDVDVKEGKGRGSGTRTIYPVEMPHCMAKSRTLDSVIVYERDSPALWEMLGAK